MVDPFRSFTMDAELPVRQTRALIIAVNKLARCTEPDATDEIYLDTIAQLTTDAWAHLDGILRDLESTLAAARESAQ